MTKLITTPEYRPNKLSAAICLALSLSATGSFAQSSEQLSEAMEEIVVTGSRIKREGFNTSTPLVAISNEDITLSGVNELSEYLVSIPGITSAINTRGSQTSTQNAGLSSVQLRGLGDNRTLVLIDGKRAVSNSANGNRVSLSTIPSAFVDRVEVITGAASAVYGSDAIAGVVNIITERDFEGTKLKVKAGGTSDGGGAERNFDLTHGFKFSDDKGYLLFSASYDKDNAIRAHHRKSALIEADFDYDDGINEFDTYDGDQAASEISQAQWADRSHYLPGGRFEDSWYNQDGEQSADDYVRNRDGFNGRPFRNISIPRERFLAAMKFDYQFNPEWQFNSQLQYSQVDTTSTRAPETHDYNDRFGATNPDTGLQEYITVGQIPSSNPLIPDSAGSGSIRWYRLFPEVGNQINDNQRETLRSWAGISGQLSDNWQLDFSIGYGRYQQEQLRRNELNLLNLRQGLDVESAADGSFQCADAEARANGCVPVNLFGLGAISAEAADYIRADLSLEPTIEQRSAQLFVTGDLIDLAHGPLGMAFGAEYRQESVDVVTDSLSQLGGVSAATIPSYDGRYEVYEAFAEFNAPLLAGLPGISYLGLEGSLRYSNYTIDNVGDVGSYSLGTTWRPIDDILVRAKYGISQRAPDLTELYSPPRGDFDSARDVCDGVTATSSGEFDQRCRLDPGIAAAIAAAGEYEQEGSTISSPNGGNLELEEETGKSFTFGLSYQPSQIDGLSIAVDYYDIEVEDAIASYSNNDIMALCYAGTGDELESNRFCRQITRDNDGQISRLVQTEENLNSISVRGIDTQVRYRFDPQWLPGELSLNLVHSRLLQKEERVAALDGSEIINDQKGELESDSPQNRAYMSLSWRHQGWKLRWTTKYSGSMVDSNERVEDYREELADNPEAEFPLYLKFDPVVTHNFSASFRHSVNDVNYRYYGGVNNVFNEQGPFIPGVGDVDSGTPGNYDSFYDIDGRFAYLGLAVEF